MIGTSISRRQANKGIDQLEEAGVTGQMFQDVFLAGLLSALGAAVAAGRNIKDDVVVLLSGAAVIQMVKRLVARVPFEPSMISQGWTWWLGPKDGNGLEGEELDCDQRSLALGTIDFVEVLREICLKEGEERITGEEKLKRLIESGVARLDPAFGWALFQEEGQKTLRWLHDTFGITYLDFFGRLLRDPDGDRYVLYLSRRGDGSWYWRVDWLGLGWRRGHPSAALPASSALA